MELLHRVIAYYVLLSYLFVPADEDNVSWSHYDYISVKMLLMVSFFSIDLVGYIQLFSSCT